MKKLKKKKHVAKQSVSDCPDQPIHKLNLINVRQSENGKHKQQKTN